MDDNNDLLTIYEAAKITRMSVSWWRKRVLDRTIEFVKIGDPVMGRIFIPRKVIDDIIARSTYKPKD